MEIWKEISGSDGMYFVSSEGRVKSTNRYKNGIILKQQTGANGCKTLLITKISRSSVQVPWLVAEAFIGPRKGKYVDHIDGDRSNNSLSNLRILTNKENNRAFKSKKKNATSIYRGVHWHRTASKWMAQICKDGKNYYLGLHGKEEDAALAYNKKAKEIGFFKEAMNKVFDYES